MDKVARPPSSLCIHTLVNLEDMVVTTPGITISVYLWMIHGDPEIVLVDGRSGFDALHVLA